MRGRGRGRGRGRPPKIEKNKEPVTPRRSTRNRAAENDVTYREYEEPEITEPESVPSPIEEKAITSPKASPKKKANVDTGEFSSPKKIIDTPDTSSPLMSIAQSAASSSANTGVTVTPEPVVKRKRGRPLLPRDEFGNIIRPPGESPKSKKHDHSLQLEEKRSIRAAAAAAAKRQALFASGDMSAAHGRFLSGLGRGRGRGRGRMPYPGAGMFDNFNALGGLAGSPSALHFDGSAAAAAAAAAVAAAGGFGGQAGVNGAHMNFFSTALDRASAFLPNNMQKHASMYATTARGPEVRFDALDPSQSGLEPALASALTHPDSKRIQWYAAPPIDLVPKAPRPSHSLKYLLYKLSRSRAGPAKKKSHGSSAQAKTFSVPSSKDTAKLESLLYNASEEIFGTCCR